MRRLSAFLFSVYLNSLLNPSNPLNLLNPWNLLDPSDLRIV